MTNDKSQITNKLQKDNEQKNKQKTKRLNIEQIWNRCRRQPVFVLNFEPLNLGIGCNLWFVICDFPASRLFGSGSTGLR
jgi:hypothetical protein